MCALQGNLDFLQIAKNKAAFTTRICRMLKSIRKIRPPLLVDRKSA
jgi:hypothetical protein